MRRRMLFLGSLAFVAVAAAVLSHAGGAPVAWLAGLGSGSRLALAGGVFTIALAVYIVD